MVTTEVPDEYGMAGTNRVAANREINALDTILLADDAS
jgi:hypothetical protein